MVNSQKFKNYFFQGVRLLLGLLFAFSGFTKAVDPMGSAIKIGDYFMHWGMVLPDSFFVASSLLLIFLEFITGFCLLFGIGVRIASLLALLFMVVFTPLTLYVALMNPVSDCGCFGDAIKISNWGTFLKNLFFLPLSIGLFWFVRQQPMDKWTWRRGFVAAWGLFLVVGIAFWAFRYEPILDFRPFALGTNIPTSMQIPLGAPLAEYETTFILEKNGKQAEFTMDNYPYNDSTWVFVDSKTKVIKEGYQPPIKDFSLQNRNGEVVTEQILTSEEPVFLVIMHKLKGEPKDLMASFNALALSATKNNQAFYVVTSSLESEVTQWAIQTPPYINWLMADETLLKTVARNNPAIVVLQKGVVVGKYTLHNLPSMEALKLPLTAGIDALKQEKSNWMILSLIFVTLFIGIGILKSKQQTNN